jgi:hypothetical protein
MKNMRFYLALLFVFMSFAYNSLTAQNIDQLKLMDKFIGKWQASRGKDTVEVWDFKVYGPHAFIVEIYQIVKGKNTPVSFNPISYDPAAGKFYGFTLLVSGYYGTWIGSFTSETKFNGDMLGNFNPEPVYGRLENLIKNPNEWIWTGYTPEGKKFLELDFVKVI